eukprot:scaffold34623_cov274-Amphora_coffeaeformis.AAC.13
MGLAPGAKGSPAKRPSGLAPVALPYTTLLWLLVELLVEARADLDGHGVDTVVIVAKEGHVSCIVSTLKADRHAVFIADGSHLETFVVGFVVCHVNHIHCGGVQLGHPRDCLFKKDRFDSIVVERTVLVTGTDTRLGTGLGEFGIQEFSVAFIAASIDAHQQQLDHVGPSAKELHIHTRAHGRYTAGNRVIRSKGGAHQIIILVLDARRGNGLLGTESLETGWQILRPQNGKVGFGGGAQVGQGLQKTERGLGDEWSSIFRAPSQGQGHPRGVPGKEVVVFGGPQVTYQTHLDDQIVNDFLQVLFGGHTGFQVSFGVNVQKAIPSTDTHGGTILLLECGNVSQPHGLGGLTKGLRWLAQITAVRISELQQILEGLDLDGNFHALTHFVFGTAVDGIVVLLFACHELIDTVEGNASVIGNDASTAIGIGKSSQ